MVGCPGRSGMFAVKSLYVTDQRAPFGPIPSCRTVLPFGAGRPPNPGGSTPGGGAAAPSVDAGLVAAPSVGCVGVGVGIFAAGVGTGAPRWPSACAICCCIWGGSGMAPMGPSGLSGCCTWWWWWTCGWCAWWWWWCGCGPACGSEFGRGCGMARNGFVWRGLAGSGACAGRNGFGGTAAVRGPGEDDVEGACGSSRRTKCRLWSLDMRSWSS